MRTGSTVRERLCGEFFLSPLLMHTGTEQLADLREVQVPVDSTPASHLEVVHAQLALGNLKTAFDGPTAERHPQQPFERDRLAIDLQVGQEVLDLTGLENVASDDQGMSRPRQTVGTVLAIERPRP
jgi:hypothetical protein